jgi:hypothetical protein
MVKATTLLAGPLMPSTPCPPLGQRPPIRCLRPIRPTFDGTAKRSRVSRVWLHRKVADEPQLVPRGNWTGWGKGWPRVCCQAFTLSLPRLPSRGHDANADAMHPTPDMVGHIFVHVSRRSLMAAIGMPRSLRNRRLVPALSRPIAPLAQSRTSWRASPACRRSGRGPWRQRWH